MVFIGYDPGGNGSHGVAAIGAEDGRPVSYRCALVAKAEEAIRWLSANSESPVAIGVDTLTCWSTGESGWRPADWWLKRRYPEVQLSVASPNSLFGSMSVNGMSTLIALKATFPELLITETHPKVLHWHLSGTHYDFASRRAQMLKLLAEQMGCEINCGSDHEWDAVLSALAAFNGISHRWQHDLHQLPTAPDERLIMPCGQTSFFWPE